MHVSGCLSSGQSLWDSALSGVVAVCTSVRTLEWVFTFVNAGDSAVTACVMAEVRCPLVCGAGSESEGAYLVLEEAVCVHETL